MIFKYINRAEEWLSLSPFRSKHHRARQLRAVARNRNNG